MRGNINLLRCLFALRAIINARRADIGERTCLKGAAEYGTLDTVQYLLISCVRTEDDSNVQSIRALIFAEKQHIVVAESLREHREWHDLDRALYKNLDLIEYKYIAFLHPLEKPLEERRRLRHLYFYDLRGIFSNLIKYASRNTVIPNFDPEIADSLDGEGDVSTEAKSEYEDDSTVSCAMSSTEGFSEILNQTHVTTNKQTSCCNTSTPINPEASLSINNLSPVNTKTEDVIMNHPEYSSILQESDFDKLFGNDGLLNEPMMDFNFQPQEDDLMNDVRKWEAHAVA